MQTNTEIKVGALVLGALALLAVLVLVIGDFSFEDGRQIKVDYVFVGSLQPGAAVRSSGIKVGKVEAIEFMGGEKNPATGERIQIRLTLWIEERALNNVRQSSRFLINTEGMLGEQYVEIIPGENESPILTHNQVVRGDDPPRTDLLMQKTFQMVDIMSRMMVENSEKFEQMFTAMNNLLQTSDKLLAKNKDHIGPLLENLSKLTADMQKAMSQTGDVRAIIENTKVLTTELRRDMGPMTRDMREAIGDLKVAGQNTVELTDPKVGILSNAIGNMDKSIGKFDASLDGVDASVEHFEQTLSRIDSMTVKLEQLLGRVAAGPARLFLADEDEVEGEKKIAVPPRAPEPATAGTRSQPQ